MAVPAGSVGELLGVGRRAQSLEDNDVGLRRGEPTEQILAKSVSTRSSTKDEIAPERLKSEVHFVLVVSSDGGS